MNKKFIQTIILVPYLSILCNLFPYAAFANDRIYKIVDRTYILKLNVEELIQDNGLPS